MSVLSDTVQRQVEEDLVHGGYITPAKLVAIKDEADAKHAPFMSLLGLSLIHIFMAMVRLNRSLSMPIFRLTARLS